MSGHSKWSQIKRQKGAADVKRGAVFSKLTNNIILAARGGGDPNTNFSLKMAISKARAANMPKENIERAIKRGTGELGGAKIEEVLYEVIGPAGAGFIVEAVTDNRNRTNSEIQNILTKYGGKLASSGAMTYQFNRLGKLSVDLTGQNQDELELMAIDAGAEDFKELDGVLVIYTQPQKLELIKQELERLGLSIKEASLSWEPKNKININKQEDAQKILNLFEALDNLDDATGIYFNFNILR